MVQVRSAIVHSIEPGCPPTAAAPRKPETKIFGLCQVGRPVQTGLHHGAWRSPGNTHGAQTIVTGCRCGSGRRVCWLSRRLPSTPSIHHGMSSRCLFCHVAAHRRRVGWWEGHQPLSGVLAQHTHAEGVACTVERLLRLRASSRRLRAALPKSHRANGWPGCT